MIAIGVKLSRLRGLQRNEQKTAKNPPERNSKSQSLHGSCSVFTLLPECEEETLMGEPSSCSAYVFYFEW